ncbi:MmgE/PrpD family protein [Bordetella sp. BOR01]|uniref:MmgE/PrpD family protein n=1 Tax=Bordetella sp. BOR01 TaxID=2854779 RepID=UPI001C4783E3|nr:MmgE/PrpD family protein [Bordetella sp. BOR01]MBV7484208.1 MmgE/PrpD family protein [Bordetella sp. BOR01]
MFATETLAEYAASLRNTDLSADVVHHAKRAVIDWYAAVFPGLACPVVGRLENALAEDLDRGDALLAGGRRSTIRVAALINGAAAHAAEIDDSFRDAMYHPGAATIAAALAAGHQARVSGLTFLRGVVLGYEVSTRIGAVLGRPHYRYWHNTGTVGTFGAAAAAAAIFGLDRDAYAHALATAATFAAGLQQAFRLDSMSKPLHAGRAAEAGVLAAILARQGVTGSLDVLDGESGLGHAMAEGPDWTHIGATLGRDFHISRLTFKNHIGCGHTFAAIDGALALRQRHGLAASDIAAVRVATYQPALDIACHAAPATANEARFSFPYVVASALIDGSVRLAAYDPPRLKDPLMLALMKRISVVVDPGIDRAFPGQRTARVEITMADGRCFEHIQAHRKGDPEEPLTDAELHDKFMELSSPTIGTGNAKMLLARLCAIESATALDW